ncbi:MAG: NAD-dependent epimerase/dehydratase family protein [Gaiellaceae bacterium]
MRRALVLGGTGAVGRAVASRLARAGWRVEVTGRDATKMPDDLVSAGVSFTRADRRDTAAVAAAFGAGADLLVDCVCYTADDARRLLPLVRSATSTVMISSKAVYVDAAGNHSNSDVAPRFDGPIRETQSTIAPNDIDYRSREGYGANKVAAEQVLLESGLPVSVLRPSKIHGRGAGRPREWIFVKRVLDRRPMVFLAHRGRGVDHTTAAANLAALVEVVAEKAGARVLNSADPDSPDGLQIARTIARLLDHEWQEVLLDGDAVGNVGRYPWDAAHPIVLDTSAALALGYSPVGDYAATVAGEVDWLVTAPRGDDPFFAALFDYAAEDRFWRAEPQGAGRSRR